MSWYLCEQLRLYPLKRLKLWISSVYWPCMPVCTTYTTSVLFLVGWEGGLLGCKHKPHLCLLGTNSTLIKSDGLGRSMHVSDLLLRCSSCSPVLQISEEELVVLLLGFCAPVAPSHLSWYTTLPPCIFSILLTLWWPSGYVLYGWALLEEVHLLSHLGPQILLYATNQESRFKCFTIVIAYDLEIVISCPWDWLVTLGWLFFRFLFLFSWAA